MKTHHLDLFGEKAKVEKVLSDFEKKKSKVQFTYKQLTTSF